eukprot:scaffold983_cov96-Skeletonema_dohrnii-CCMP3373.AAC.2
MVPPSERRVRRRLAGSMNETNLTVAEADDDHEHDDGVTATGNQLTGNVVAIIFGFLPLKDIIRLRCVCSDWKDAAKGTIVSSELKVDRVNKFRLMEKMTTDLPNLHHLSIGHLRTYFPRELDPRVWHTYVMGDNPHEGLAEETSHYIVAHDIGVISNFQKLRSLSIIEAPLNGQYPVLFNFPLLTRLKIEDNFAYPNYLY